VQNDNLEKRFEELLQVQRDVPTSWTVRQRDSLDRLTAFIYGCDTIKEVLDRSQSVELDETATSYALHRWKNFVRHDAWLDLILSMVPDARPFEVPRDRTRDLYLALNGGETVFDLKVTRWPSRLPESANLRQVAEWMYANQSQQSRHHLDNRLFVVGKDELILCDIHAARRNVTQFWINRKTSVFQVHIDGHEPTAGVLRVSD
jgi:hypothetical protein